MRSGFDANIYSLQDPGYQFPATYQPQSNADATNPNALPDTSQQFDRAAAMGYGVLEKRKKKAEAFVQTKEYDESAYEQATNEAEDEELEKGFLSEDVQRFLDEQAMKRGQAEKEEKKEEKEEGK